MILNKTKLRAGILILLLVSIAGIGRAQNHIQATYDYSMPLGNSADYIDNGSFRGGSFEFGHHINGRMVVGLKVGLHTFFQKLDKDTYTSDNVTIYGKQFRYMNSFPALVSFQYNLSEEEKKITTYVKTGIGGWYLQQRTDLGLYTFSNDHQWTLGLQPEIGLLIPLSEYVKINISSRYNYLFKNVELDDQMYVNFSLGIMFYNLGGR